MADFLTRLRLSNTAVSERDERLRMELEAIRARTNAAPEPEGALRLPGGTDDMPLVMETIVRRTGRPVLSVARDEARLEFSDAESEVWRQRLQTARTQIIAAIRAVGRIELAGHPDYEWVGTGWLAARDIVVTNRHVAAIFSRREGQRFVFRSGLTGAPIRASIDFLEEAGRDEALEFALVRVHHIEDERGPDMAFLEVSRVGGSSLASHIVLAEGSAPTDQDVAVIGYPARDSRLPDQPLMDQIFGDVYNKKRLAPGKLLPMENGLVRHDCSTLGGNSGSVVLDLESGQAVGLHFSGRFLVSNYAVPSGVVAARLRSLGRAGRPRRGARPTPDAAVVDDSNQGVLIDSDNAHGLEFTIPVRVRVEIGSPDADPASRPWAVSRATGRDASDGGDEVLAEGRPEDYDRRKGFMPGFLGSSARVELPRVTRREREVLEFTLHGERTRELAYEHFTVVMNRVRRMCFFSAVNVDGRKSRKGVRGAWRFDPRIPEEAQIKGECYGNPPRFSRGHMTRREDPIWGTKAEAKRGGDDSMHVTNAVPQMQGFNAPIWLGLEDYALDHAREDDMRISVITGPFFDDDDPFLYGVQIPRDFWKVIAFVHDETGKLCATGYTMSQADQLPEEEFVFGDYTNREGETTQVALSTIERRAGISFGELAEADPLAREEGLVERPIRAFDQIRYS